MNRLILICALALAACGPAKEPAESAAPSASGCLLLADAAALFGAGAIIEERTPLEDMGGGCRWESADGAREAEMIVYTAESLAKGAAMTAQARFDDRAGAWKALTEEAPRPLDGVGDQAQIWTGFAGGQTQVLARKGEVVLLVAAGSIDKRVSGESLAKQLAQALLKSL